MSPPPTHAPASPTNRFPLGELESSASRGRRRRVAERAKALASGFESYETPSNIPDLLAEAAYLCDESHNSARPLLERIRILGLMATALDQLCVDQGSLSNGEEGGVPASTLFSDAIYEAMTTLLGRASRLLRTELLPGLARDRSVLTRQPATLSREQRVWLRSFFQAQIFPLLTPLAIDPGHPFPFISSYSLNFLVLLRGLKPGTSVRESSYARIKVPRMLSRFVELPPDESGEGPAQRSFLWSEDIVRFFLPELFPGLVVENAYLFRVLRPIPALNQQAEIFDSQPVLHHRHLHASVVRLDVEADLPAAVLDWLSRRLNVAPGGIYPIDGHMALFQLTDLVNLIEGNDAVRVLI